MKRKLIAKGYIVFYEFEGEWILARRALNPDGSLNREDVFYTATRPSVCVIESKEEAEVFAGLLATKASEIMHLQSPLQVKIETWSKSHGTLWGRDEEKP